MPSLSWPPLKFIKSPQPFCPAVSVTSSAVCQWMRSSPTSNISSPLKISLPMMKRSRSSRVSQRVGCAMRNLCSINSRPRERRSRLPSRKLSSALLRAKLFSILSHSVLDHQPAHGLETIHRALDSGADPRSLARQIVEYLRGLMLIQMGNIDQVEATREVKAQMDAHAKSFSTSDVLRMMKIFNNAATDLRGGWQPSLSIELALAEVLDAPTESPQIAAPRQTQPKPAPVSKAESKPEVKSASSPRVSEAPVSRKTRHQCR